MLYRTLAEGKCVCTPKDERDVTFDHSCDVCVAGLGTAGAISAVVCAEKGASVFGIDRTTMMGGLGTSGVLDYYFGTPGGTVCRFNEACYDLIDSGKYLSTGGRDIRPEALPGFLKSNTLLKAATDAGARLLFDARLTGVYTEGKKVVGVECFDGKSFINISCKVLIDGADGSACRLCGCDFMPVRSDGHTMQFSHMLTTYDRRYVRCACRFNGFPDSENTAEWTKKLLRSTLSYEKYDFGIATESALPGIRENRNVMTDNTFDLASLAKGEACVKPLFYGFAPVDNCTRDKQNEPEVIQDWFVLCKMERFGLAAPMPMAALIPKGYDNILVVGKATGLGHELSACLRMKFDMEKCGEAAAYMAVSALRHGCDVREVPYEEVLAGLKESGAFSLEHNIGVADLNEPIPEKRLWKSYVPPKNTDELREALSSREPGTAIWYLRNHCTDSEREALVSFLSSDDRFLCENSAVALGVLGDERCLPVLRDILSKPPVGVVYTVPKGNTPYGWLNKTSFCNFTKAIILLGRFRDKESVPLLRRIVETEGREADEAKLCEEGYTRLSEMADEFYAFAKASLSDIESER